MSVSSPDKDFFSGIGKPYQVKGAALDRILNVGNDMRINLIEGFMYDETATINKSVGSLVFVNKNDGTGDPLTFIFSGNVTNTSVTFLGGTCYINGKRIITPSSVLTLTSGSTNYIYLDITGVYNASINKPIGLHIPVAVIGDNGGALREPTNDPSDTYYDDSWYAWVWNNGAKGGGQFSGQSLAYKDFGYSSNLRTWTVDVANVDLGLTNYGTVTIKNFLQIDGSSVFTSDVQIDGNLTVLGDMKQIDVSAVIDNFIIGDADKLLFGYGVGDNPAAPEGDFGFQWVRNSTDANSAAILGLGNGNARLFIGLESNMIDTEGATGWNNYLDIHGASTVPEIVFTDGSLTTTNYLRINNELMKTGSTSDGSYAFHIDTLLNTGESLRIESGHNLDLISLQAINLNPANAKDITLTTGTTGAINLTSAGDFQITGNTVASLIGTTSSDLTISTTSSGDLILDSIDNLTIDTAASGSMTLTTADSDLSLVSGSALNLSGGTVIIQDGGTSYWQFNLNELSGIHTTSNTKLIAYTGYDLLLEAIGSDGDVKITTNNSTSTIIINSAGALTLDSGSGDVTLTAVGGEVIIGSVITNLEDHAHAGSGSGEKISEVNITNKANGMVQFTAADFSFYRSGNDNYNQSTDSSTNAPYIEGYGNVPVIKWNANQTGETAVGFFIPPDGEANSTELQAINISGACESAGGTRTVTVKWENVPSGKTSDSFSTSRTATFSFFFDSGVNGWQNYRITSFTGTGQTFIAGDHGVLSVDVNSTSGAEHNFVLASLSFEYTKNE